MANKLKQYLLCGQADEESDEDERPPLSISEPFDFKWVGGAREINRDLQPATIEEQNSRRARGEEASYVTVTRSVTVEHVTPEEAQNDPQTTIEITGGAGPPRRNIARRPVPHSNVRATQASADNIFVSSGQTRRDEQHSSPESIGDARRPSIGRATSAGPSQRPTSRFSWTSTHSGEAQVEYQADTSTTTLTQVGNVQEGKKAKKDKKKKRRSKGSRKARTTQS